MRSLARRSIARGPGSIPGGDLHQRLPQNLQTRFRLRPDIARRVADGLRSILRPNEHPQLAEDSHPRLSKLQSQVRLQVHRRGDDKIRLGATAGHRVRLGQPQRVVGTFE